MTSDGYYKVIKMLPSVLQAALRNVPQDISRRVNEIRIRAYRPTALILGGETIFPNKFGNCFGNIPSDFLTLTRAEMEEAVYLLCGGSVYCHQDEICQGFISLPHGHRAGICGEGVLSAEGALQNIKNISSINIRIANEVKGCSQRLGREDILGGLIISGPPASGKTTMLRDIIRRCASGEFGAYIRVAVADERGEIAAFCQGKSGADIGLADVMSGIRKSKAVMMAVRTLNPQIVAFDELGSADDVRAVKSAAVSGVDFIATIHSSSCQDLFANPFYKQLEPHTKTVVFLGERAGEILEIFKPREKKNANIRTCDNIVFNAFDGDHVGGRPSPKGEADRNFPKLYR